MTKTALLEKLEQLDPRERLELTYGLLDSVLHDVAAPPFTDGQRHELKDRLAQHHALP